ncbi:MAG: hypothetical protein ACTS3F_11110 [Phycisphaerales bacterium]
MERAGACERALRGNGRAMDDGDRGQGGSGGGRWEGARTGIPLEGMPRRRVENEASGRASGSEEAGAGGALDPRVGEVTPTAGEAYSPSGVVGADEERRARDAARTPSMFLAAPGMVALLFAGMAERMGTPGGSAIPMLLVALVSSGIGGACFWVLASKAESSEGRLVWMIGVGAAVALLMRAVVMAV